MGTRASHVFVECPEGKLIEEGISGDPGAPGRRSPERDSMQQLGREAEHRSSRLLNYSSARAWSQKRGGLLGNPQGLQSERWPPKPLVSVLLIRGGGCCVLPGTVQGGAGQGGVQGLMPALESAAHTHRSPHSKQRGLLLTLMKKTTHLSPTLRHPALFLCVLLSSNRGTLERPASEMMQWSLSFPREKFGGWE